VANLTLEDIGNLGDFIAAIATIATLAYLAYQIRLNTKSNQASAASAWFEQESTLAMFIAQHANIYRRGSTSFEGLNEDEAVVYLQIVALEIGDVWSGMVQHKNGLISVAELATYEVMWKNFMARGAFVQHGWTSGVNTRKISSNGSIVFPPRPTTICKESRFLA
jgi:hypothetical protein